MNDKPIYLDYHATTPLDPRVREVLFGAYDSGLGNPHSTSHSAGWRAHEAVEAARKEVAALIGARAYEIIFTSGASEANNLAILGACRAKGAGHIVTSAIEHPSVLEACRHLAEHEGFSLDVIPVDKNGIVELSTLEAVLKPETILVSIMLANNEIGTLQPGKEIGAMVGEIEAIYHADATQAIGRIGVDVADINAALMSISGHKIHGPMGVGALYVGSGTKIEPLVFGGSQESTIRPGTVPTPLVAAFGEACRIARTQGLSEQKRIGDLRDRLLEGLKAKIPGLKVNGSMDHRLACNLNVSFPNVRAEQILLNCPGIAASTGAACATGSQKPSPVLKAIGLTAEEIEGAVRFGLGRFTTRDEIDVAIDMLTQAFASLR